MNTYLIKEVETIFGKRTVGDRALTKRNAKHISSCAEYYNRTTVDKGGYFTVNIDSDGSIAREVGYDINFVFDTIDKITYCPETNHFEIWVNNDIIEEFHSTDYRIKR